MKPIDEVFCTGCDRLAEYGHADGCMNQGQNNAAVVKVNGPATKLTPGDVAKALHDTRAVLGYWPDPDRLDGRWRMWGAVLHTALSDDQMRKTASDSPDLREVIRLFRGLVEDPFTFATDPDGDCFFCDEPCEPVAEHDADSDCLVSQMRKAWGELQSAALLYAIDR